MSATRGIEDLVAAELRAAGAEPWSRLTTPDAVECERLRALLPGATTLLTVPRRVYRRRPGGFIRIAADLGLHGINPSFHHLTPRFVAEARRLSLQVTTWTVDDPADIARVLALGVDSITSNHPRRVIDASSELGEAAAAADTIPG